MKKVLILIITIFSIISCDKAPINGKLDGMWKMTYMQWSNGEKTNPERIFFCFEQDCIQVSNKGSKPCDYIGLMKKENGIIRVSDFKNSGGDIQNTEILKQFGMIKESTEFKIEKLSSSKLIIKSEDCSLYFIKF